MKAIQTMLKSVQMTQELKAHVQNGRIVVDTPTNLPEGHEVLLQLVHDDGMSTDERDRLHAAINESLDDIEADRGSDMAEFLEELKEEA
jgi:hypothetical protein